MRPALPNPGACLMCRNTGATCRALPCPLFFLNQRAPGYIAARLMYLGFVLRLSWRGCWLPLVVSVTPSYTGLTDGANLAPPHLH